MGVLRQTETGLQVVDPGVKVTFTIRTQSDKDAPYFVNGINHLHTDTQATDQEGQASSSSLHAGVDGGRYTVEIAVENAAPKSTELLVLSIDHFEPKDQSVKEAMRGLVTNSLHVMALDKDSKSAGGGQPVNIRIVKGTADAMFVNGESHLAHATSEGGGLITIPDFTVGDHTGSFTIVITTLMTSGPQAIINVEVHEPAAPAKVEFTELPDSTLLHAGALMKAGTIQVHVLDTLGQEILTGKVSFTIDNTSGAGTVFSSNQSTVAIVDIQNGTAYAPAIRLGPAVGRFKITATFVGSAKVAITPEITYS